MNREMDTHRTETIYIQVCGCFDDDETHDVVPFVPDNAAEYYGVYVGATSMEWIADFAFKSDAMLFALDMASAHKYVVDDRTYAFREEPK